MRNRIGKHCNAINAKGGEVNNKFQHLFVKCNRPEAQFHHAPFYPHNSCYQGGTQKYQKIYLKKYKFISQRIFGSRSFALLTSLIHNDDK